MRGVGLWLALLLQGCHAAPRAEAPAPVRGETLAAMLLPDAEVRVSLKPSELSRSPQALVRSMLPLEHTEGLARALFASERVVLVVHRRQGGENVGLALLGVPSSEGPEDLRDETGEPLLVRGCGELPVPCYRDAQPAQDLPRRLYVVESRRWFVAVGAAAIERAERVLRRHDRASWPDEESERGFLAHYDAESLRRRMPRLRAGPLAPLATGLEDVSLELLPRTASLQLQARYTGADAAAEAEPLARRTLGAWSRSRGDDAGRLVSLTRRGERLHVLLHTEPGAPSF